MGARRCLFPSVEGSAAFCLGGIISLPLGPVGGRTAPNGDQLNGARPPGSGLHPRPAAKPPEHYRARSFSSMRAWVPWP